MAGAFSEKIGSRYPDEYTTTNRSGSHSRFDLWALKRQYFGTRVGLFGAPIAAAFVAAAFLAAAFLAAALLSAALLGLAGPVLAQSYPTRTISLVVPYPPGGGVDALARIVADRLSAALKQSVVVDNRAGAGGNLGTRAVAKAEPDGHTLLLGHTGTISINPSLYANAGYDPRKDFTPIGLIASMPVALIAHPSFPAKS